MSLLLPALTFAPAFAEATSSVKSTTTVQTVVDVAPPTTASTNDSSDSGKKIGVPSTDPALMKKRLDGLKASLKINLDDTTKKHLELKCKPAQSMVVSAASNDKANGTKRDDAYKKITDGVSALIARLKANGVDTATLATSETALEQKVASFNTDMTTYQQTLTDLQLLDCITDPAAFQAALITARTQRETVRKDALDIRTYITATLKPALEAVKLKLKPVAATQPVSTTTATDKTKATTTAGGNQ